MVVEVNKSKHKTSTEMETTALKKFLLKYPGLVQSESTESEFRGNIRLQNKWYRLRIICPSFPSTSQLRITVSTGLQTTTLDSSHFEQFSTIDRALENIANLLHSQNHLATEDLGPNLYEAHNEILQLKSPSYKIHTNAQCTVIRFSDFDRFKGHYLELRLNHKKEFDLHDHSLPSDVQWEELFRASNSIQVYLTQFLKFLEELRDFYTNLTDIDELCYVVQPLNPSIKDNWRIIKLKDRVFVKLVLDPFTSSPVLVNLIGPTYEVEPLRYVLSEGLKNWDTEMDVHANLLRTFELTYFPMASDDAEQFCNICYCYDLEGHVPFISCDNRSCSLVYHAVCLKEWFTTLADGKVFLDVAFGACPFCKEKLSTSFADVLK